jgi:hypothetical protein
LNVTRFDKEVYNECGIMDYNVACWAATMLKEKQNYMGGGGAIHNTDFRNAILY